jgi:hypothetical protein
VWLEFNCFNSKMYGHMYRHHVHIHMTSFEWNIAHTVSNITLQ